MRLITLKNRQNHKTQSKRKALTFENSLRLHRGRQKVLNGFESKIFPTKKQTKGKGLKILAPKQMHQRLPITLVQEKAGNKSENLLNEIRQIIYHLY